MNMPPITFQEIIMLIQELNTFSDEMDSKILSAQSQYETSKAKINSQYSKILSKFDSDCSAATNYINKNSQNLISDARKISNEIGDLDKRLSSIDKYYVKTKEKKEAELSGRKSDKFSGNKDYFAMLNNIKKEYTELSKKYSTDILPSVINGINYLFSSKRKKEYEELIILKNTVEGFIKEITEIVPELTNDTLQEMKIINGEKREDLIKKHQLNIQGLDSKYGAQIDELAQEILVGLEAILPKELIDFIAESMSSYEKSIHKVNTTSTVADNILFQGYIDYPLNDFVQSTTLASLILNKCKKLIIDRSIKFPIIISTTSSPSFYMTNRIKNSKVAMEFAHSVMYSFLSQTPISHLTFNIFDTENHGNSVEPYFDAKKKLPQLFSGKLFVSKEETATKLRSISETVAIILQNNLGTQFKDVFQYACNNPEYELNVQLLVLFDFPKGLDEESLSKLGNIITFGPRCGIYTLIIEGESDRSNLSKSILENAFKIKNKCTVLGAEGNELSFFGLKFSFMKMPERNEFNGFFSKYMLIEEGIKNKGIGLPSSIKKLIESNDELNLQKGISNIRRIMEGYEKSFGNVPPLDNSFPMELCLGYVHYPPDVFSEAFGYEKIKKYFLNNGEKIELPLVFELNNSVNLFINSPEDKAVRSLDFTHHLIWNFLSSIPNTKANICVIDCLKKGSSIYPFLGMRKRLPDIFDSAIYTNGESLYERLSKINNQIEEFIQEKLGNKYENILQYNRNTPSRAESITLLAIYDFPAGFDSRSIELLLNILRNGSKCGVYSMISFNPGVNYSSYDNIEERIDQIRQYCGEIQCRDKDYVLLPFNLPITIKGGLSNEKIEAFVDKYVEDYEVIKNRGLSFKDIVDKKLFSRDSSSALTIPVGIGDGEVIVPLVLGKGSSHHGLIAGATGSGKSTLLHTIIMSAMLNYSPDNLHLYLMDFKSGTEFKIYDSYRLPHIKLLALDAMQEFGESILENLVEEMTARSEKFKRSNVTKLGEYHRVTGNSMARILVIMDEFQILFNDSSNRKVAMKCAELTKRIVTEGRSFGIHLLMATQSTKVITDLSLSTGTIEQMRIRIGLKCGPDDARYLFTDNKDYQALEMMKGPIGTAVMNPEYTEEENIGFRAAYCDSVTQENFMKVIAENFEKMPHVLKTFEGNRTVPLLIKYAESDLGLNSELPLAIELGTLIKVAPPFSMFFDRRRKHNTIICGSNNHMVENLTHLFALSILKNLNCSLYSIDGEALVGEEPLEGVNKEFLRFGDKFKVAQTRGHIINFINEIYDLYVSWKKQNNNQQIYVMLKNLQFLDIVKAMMKGETIEEKEYVDTPKENDVEDDVENNILDFGFNDFSTDNISVTEKLLKLIEDGSAYGVHFIVTCADFQTIKENMYYGENVLTKFPERFIFSLSDSDADSLIENVAVSSLRDTIVYYSDSVKNTFQLKPYVFPKVSELHDYLNTIL